MRRAELLANFYHFDVHMGRRVAQINVEKRIKQGFGQGHGRDYKPWLAVQSFSSRGYASRVPGIKTGREHHVMSNLELDFFLTLEWSPRVLDVREQYPLHPIDETLAIAAGLGIRHPTNPKTKKPIVLTTDFLISVRNVPRDTEEARAVKPASELQSLRTLEKLQIERFYWDARNVNWGIVTEQDIPKSVSDNLRWLHPYFEPPRTPSLSKEHVDAMDRMLRDLMREGTNLANAARACDAKLGFEPGVSLSWARHFIASRLWAVNIREKIDPALPLKIINETDP